MRRREIDTALDKGKRKRLIAILKEKGISKQQVLDAINTIPRHFYIDTVFDSKAYDDVDTEFCHAAKLSCKFFENDIMFFKFF